jgi:hypothetical protein
VGPRSARVGKTFHPRIRDLQSHVDYRLGPGQPELQVDQLGLPVVTEQERTEPVKSIETPGDEI